MHRLATTRVIVLLLWCLVVVMAAVAAPAPIPKPMKVWETGWDKPVDPVGDCRFDRNGDKLTITVPGEGHGWRDDGRELNAPRLLRSIEGDFTLEVRVKGNFDQPTGFRTAGIVLLAGTNEATMYFSPWLFISSLVRPGRSHSHTSFRINKTECVYLRLQRRDQRLLMKTSLDGKVWDSTVDEDGYLDLPRKLSVGVVASATAEGKFEAVFDQFVLTVLPPRQGQPPHSK